MIYWKEVVKHLKVTQTNDLKINLRMRLRCTVYITSRSVAWEADEFLLYQRFDTLEPTVKGWTSSTEFLQTRSARINFIEMSLNKKTSIVSMGLRILFIS